MFLSIDDRDPRPAYLQIAASIKQQVSQGTLTPGTELPSVRELARELGINLHTARHAYQVLHQQGVVHLRLGRRARIAAPPTPQADGPGKARMAQLVEELIAEAFHLGIPADQVRTMVEECLTRHQDGRRQL